MTRTIVFDKKQIVKNNLMKSLQIKQNHKIKSFYTCIEI